MKLKAVAAAVLCCASSLVVAGTMGDVATAAPRFYVGAEGGGSISLLSNINPKLHTGATFTQIAPFGPELNRDIGMGGFGGAFLGYQYNPNVAIQFTYDYRTGYDYTFVAQYGLDPDLNYLEDSFETLGNINVQTFLFDLYLKPTVNWGGFVPYVKGGIGIGYNEMPVLRDVDFPMSGIAPTFDTLYRTNTVTSFAWDAGVGADYYFTDQISFGMSYRFVDAGKLSTSTIADDAITGITASYSPFTTNHLFLNEFVASVAYHFDYA